MDGKCGCKGIRTCLVCEKSTSEFKPYNVQESADYDYCACCNLCYPTSNVIPAADTLPFHLHGINLLPEFITNAEEQQLVASIDKIPWEPSQSGRRKQDFGPKVNFKKRKVKPGSFKGFPQFMTNLLKRLKNVPELVNFKPVELCHLEYCPERGSAIAPHLDDSWLWGNRLVTLNLLSGTSLILSPTWSGAAGRCACNGASAKPFAENTFTLTALAPRELSKIPTHPLHSGERKVEIFSSLRSHQFDQATAEFDIKERASCNSPYRAGNVLAQPDAFAESELQTPEDCGFVSRQCSVHNGKISMSSAHSSSKSDSSKDMKKHVRLRLPPRSLLVLHGCSRHHWYHAIQRQDITSRRIAVTLRELASDFLVGGAESEKGSELLRLASQVVTV